MHLYKIYSYIEDSKLHFRDWILCELKTNHNFSLHRNYNLPETYYYKHGKRAWSKQKNNKIEVIIE